MIIKDLLIYDFGDKRAQKFEFAPGANIIVADDTSVGKSCLLKSLFYGLGIDIGQFAQGWNYKKMLFKVTYTHNSHTGTIVRYNDRFYLDGATVPVKPQEYSRYIMQILGIELLLPLKEIQELRVPYPSAIFLPFYVDQDSSWSGAPYRDATRALKMYQSTAIPSEIFRNYFGITSHEIIQLQEKKAVLSKEFSRLNLRYEVLDEMQPDFVSKKPEAILLAGNELKKQVDYYLTSYSRLNREIIEYQAEMLSLQQELDSKKARLSEVEYILKETKSIEKKISHKCTQCDSELTEAQSIKTLALENNKVALRLAASELKESIAEFEKKIDSKSIERSEVEQKQKNIGSVIEHKQAQYSVHEYISSVANSKSQERYLNIVTGIDESRSAKEKQVKTVSSQIARLKRGLRERQDMLGKEYSDLLSKLAMSFSEIEVLEEKYPFLEFKIITDSGNKRSEVYFCLYLTYLRLLAEYSQVKLPIGLDSVIKDETNEFNYKQIYPKIEEYLLKTGAQCFVAMLSDKLSYISGDYHTIHLTKPILDEAKFSVYSCEIEDMFHL